MNYKLTNFLLMPSAFLLMSLLAGCGGDDLGSATNNVNDVGDVDYCTLEYEPICAKVKTDLQCVTSPCPDFEYVTFGNQCAAEQDEGVQISFSGECAAADLENQMSYWHKPVRLYFSQKESASMPMELPESEGISIVESSIDEDVLTVTLSYPGCEEQPIDLNVQFGLTLVSLPLQVNYAFSKNREDNCERLIQSTYQYDLLPVLTSFRSAVESEEGLAILGLGRAIYKR